MSRRPLWETLVELADAAAPIGRAAGTVRVDTLDITMPVELTMRVHDGETELCGAAPGWRWTTPFDLPASRLTMSLGMLGGEAPPS